MKWKIIITLAIALPVVFTIFLSWFLGPDDLRGCSKPSETTKCQSADAIIAVSGGDTAARAAEAIKLYNDGWASIIIFSGAAQDTSGPSNAAAMKKQAVAAGIEEKFIFTEEYGRTTAENAENTSVLVNELNLHRVILVTSAYHQRRANMEFTKWLGENVTIINHPVAQDKQWSSGWWLTPGGWWLALGEFIKILLTASGQGS